VASGGVVLDRVLAARREEAQAGPAGALAGLSSHFFHFLRRAIPSVSQPAVMGTTITAHLNPNSIQTVGDAFLEPAVIRVDVVVIYLVPGGGLYLR
jgi:hypothetical protein